MGLSLLLASWSAHAVPTPADTTPLQSPSILQLASSPVPGPAPATTLTPTPIPEEPALWKTSFRLNNPERNVAVTALAELGGFGFVSHTFQTGTNGTLFDLRQEANQSTTFFFARLSAELELYKRHSLVFVYQPIDVRTEAVAKRELVFDQLVFPTGTPMDVRYGFDYYRLVYQVDIFKSPRHELAFGLGAQLRNAKIVFTSVDGKLRSVSDDLGVVPLLHARGRYTFRNGVFLGFEVDGFYADVKFLNGGKSDVKGSILDASIRAGLAVTSFLDAFLNVRYLGGGASGTSNAGSDNLGGDGFNYNSLHALAVSIGFAVR